MTELYINKKKVDLSKEIAILLSKTRTDYINPTVVKNSFSKTVTLPGTNSNNALFNEIWMLDRTQWTGAFNPSKRVDFELITDGTLDEMGYAKLNKISKSNGIYNYDITLYGEIGNILYTLSYDIDETTQEITDLTLGDLIYEQALNFTISKQIVNNAWIALKNNTENIYQTLNFAPAYNGTPKANKFDATKVWVAELSDADITMWGTGRTKWDGEDRLGMPKEKTVDNKTYKTLSTMISGMEPNDHYGLIELPDAVTDLEIRDFRSYLLRPVLRLSKIFEAIDRYIYKKKEWHLILDDPFFLQSDYKDAWVTLNMLYEINPDVESYTQFLQKDLLSKTAAPFKYLVSFCKMYGLYLDIDVTKKTLTLRSLKNFFNDKTENLVVNEGSTVSIDPLSFNKASYTFDFGESKDADFIKKYNDIHEVPYGSKKVNTGYQFDSSTDKYIKDNIFKNATDAIEQSPYYRFSQNYPASLCDDDSAYIGAKELKYTLFADGRADDTETDRYTATILRGNNTGLYYIAPRITWGGLQAGVYQDDYPKVQLHNDKNESVDGSNIIIYFRGMTATNVAKPYYDVSSKKMTWMTDSTVNSNTFYNLSDDNPVLKRAIGKNCWINNVQPDVGYGAPGTALVIKEIPNFTREDYSYESPALLFQDGNFQSFSIEKVNGCTASAGPFGTFSVINASNASGSTSGVSVYFYHPTELQADHKYLILASVNIEQSYVGDLFTKYAGAEATTNELIDHLDIDAGGRYAVTGSVMRSHTSSSHKLFPCKMCGPNKRTYNMSVRWFVIYDLTLLGIEDRVNTVKDGISIMGVPTDEDSFMGTPYSMITSHDFSTPVEIYVPNTFAVPGRDIYDRYWKEYIADLYSIDTRVLTAEIQLEDIHDSFKKFYWYNNALWCLSSITDWNPETKICKATLLKVNDKGNYTDYMDIIPATFNAPYEGAELDLTFIKNGDAATVTWTSNNEWIHDLNNAKSGQFSEDSYTFVIDANSGTSHRTGTITFNWKGKTYMYIITQDGIFLANVVVIGGTCNYTLSTTTFSPGDKITLTMTPGDHEHIVSVYANKEDVTNSIQNGSLSYTAKNENVTFYINIDHDPVYDIDIENKDPEDGDITITTPEDEPVIGPVFQGDTIVMHFNPKPHWHVSVFTIDGVSHIDEIVDNRYVLENVQSRPNIVVEYAEDPMFDINIINMDPTLGSVSAISTEGRRDRVYLHENVVVTFSLIPLTDVYSFKINGKEHVSEISNNQYTIRDVKSTQNIFVEIHTRELYNVFINTVEPIRAGNITTATPSENIEYGQSTTIAFTPKDSYWRVESLMVDGVEHVGDIVNNKYVHRVTQNTYITVRWSADPVSLTINATPDDVTITMNLNEN